MPNAYTSEIYDGTDVNPANYLRRVARGFGAYVEFRDSSLTDQLPSLPPTLPDDAYERRSLLKAQAGLVRLEMMTETEAIAEFESERERHEILMAEIKRNQTELQKRYDDVLAAIVHFVPPSDEHAEFLSTALRHLRESMEFDISTYAVVPFYKEFDDWWEAALASARRSVQYAQDQLDKAIQRTESRYAWATALNGAIEEFARKLDLEQTHG